MCGIVYAEDFNGNPVNNAIMQQFDKQRSRGVEGFGLFDGQEGHMVHAAKEDKILKWLVKYDSNLILFHHRYPTSTVNVKRAAHPFSTKDHFGDTQYVLVHNGHIANAEDLFEEHQEMGIEYQSLLQDWTFNDSEALLWDFARYMEGEQKELTAYGGIAFICLKLVKGKLEKMYFGRNSNPLNLLRTKEGISLSSEGEGELIKADTLYTWNYKLKRLTKRELEISRWKPIAYDTNYYGSQDSYDNYDWGDRDITQSTKAGAWIGESLREKFGLDNLCEDCFGNLDYNGMCVECGAYRWDWELAPPTPKLLSNTVDDYVKEVVAEEDKALFSEHAPTDQEVEMEAMAYLAAAKGHFETAYWMVEGDYYEAEEAYSKDNNETTLRKFILTELTLARINSDPEFEDGECYSSTWEALWKQQTLA